MECFDVSILVREFFEMKRRLLYIVNVDWFFLSHRLPIALQALSDGYEVHVACSDTGRMGELVSSGFFVHPLTLEEILAFLVICILSFRFISA